MEETMSQEVLKTVRTAAGWSIVLAILMIALGCLAIFMPMVTGITASIFFAWILLISGFVYFFYAFTAEGAGGVLWRLLIGVLYIIGGLYLMFNPAIALESLTFALAVILGCEGIFQLIGFFAVRALPGAGWLLFDGIISVLLAVYIGNGWPANSSWVLGTVVGVNLLFSGFNRLMYSSAVRGITAPAH